MVWALIPWFLLSAVVESAIKKETISRLIGDDSPKSLAIASGLDAASSSCSYAAVALTRSLFRKRADFTATMAFENASTNLVIEPGVMLVLLLGWQFTLAEPAPQAEHADVIAVGAPGKGHLTDRVLGSFTQRLLHQSHHPVTIVHRDWAELPVAVV